MQALNTVNYSTKSLQTTPFALKQPSFPSFENFGFPDRKSLVKVSLPD